MSTYMSLVRDLASVNLSDIETDLRLARSQLDQARAAVRAIENRVQTLQALVDLASSEVGEDKNSGRMTLHGAMAEVLTQAPERMMRAGDLASEIQRRRLYQMRDGRAVEPQQIHARVGHYDDLFEKVGTFIKLRG